MTAEGFALEAPVREARLSPSALERWRLCRKLFWYRDVSRTRVEVERSPVLAQALSVHAALDRFFGLAPVEELRSRENMHAALRSVWCEFRAGAFANGEEEERFGREALGLLDRFYESFDVLAEPMVREHWLTMRLPNGVRLVGKVDRIDATADGEGLEIIDYKTGTRLLEADDLRQEAAVWMYSVAGQALYKRPVRKVSFLYLRHGLSVDWYPESEDLLAAKRRLIELTSEIAAADTYPASPGQQCRWCDYRHLCVEAGRVSAEELEAPEGLPF